LFQGIYKNEPVIFRKKRKKNNINIILKIFHSATVAIIPMNVDQDIRGFIGFGRQKGVSWTQENIELFQTIADILTGAWRRQVLVSEKIIAERKHTEAVQTAEEALRFASIGALAAGITHEINQPLNALSMAVNGMLYWESQNRSLPVEEVYDKLKFISKQASRIDEIILQMRVLAKQETAPEPVEFDINESIKNSLLLIEQRLKAHNIQIAIELDEKPLPISGNPTQIEQIILNLVSNAMNVLDTMSKEDKKIVIHTKLKEKSCQITVFDNGPGIPEEYLDNIFDAFFTTRIKGESMGFGLSIAQKITSEHGGKIIVTNRKEGGAKFTINFPVFKK
jgi:signal transduction histidine kinase